MNMLNLIDPVTVTTPVAKPVAKPVADLGRFTPERDENGDEYDYSDFYDA